MIKIGEYAATDVIRGWDGWVGATGRGYHAIEFDFFGSRWCQITNYHVGVDVDLKQGNGVDTAHARPRIDVDDNGEDVPRLGWAMIRWGRQMVLC